MRTEFPRQAGVTLIELIVALVIVGIALGGLALVLARTSAGSVDPIVTQQKVAIAESLMGEILLRQYDRDAAVPAAGAPRASFTDVGQFQNYTLNNGIVDPNNTPMPGLESFTVKVAVTPSAFGTGSGAIAVGDPTNIYAATNNALRIDVTVNRLGDRAADAFVLSGWRMRP
jgi:MSHA pilin protein MshD